MRINASPALLTVFCLLSLILQGSYSILAHDDHRGRRPGPGAVNEHRQRDFGFPGFEKLNKELYQDYLLFDNAENLALSQYDAMRPAAPDSHLVGSWSSSFALPLVPIHVMLLTNGKVLMWDSVGDNPTESYPDHDFTRASIWDPATNDVTNVNNGTIPQGGTGFNLFCAGFAHLPDGTPFLAGGNRNNDLEGLNTIHFFNQINNTWSLGPVMAHDRWYPSVTPLANGEMLITAGLDSPHRHEVYGTNGLLRTLSNATLAMPDYPWFHAAPEGRAFYFGPDDRMRYLNPNGTGAWDPAMPTRDGINRDYGSFAMYDIGKVLASGGARPATSSTVRINISNPSLTPNVTTLSNMAFARRQHNLTVLPDGSVLATGGFTGSSNLVNLNTSVLAAELWEPGTQSWHTLSSAARKRQYHSTAILLPDARIFTGGGGICGDCHNAVPRYLEKNMEIFTPPYLYMQDGSGQLAPRPQIVSAPDVVDFNESFFVETPAPNSIDSAVMMRVSSVTHSVDFEQRRVPLNFSTTVNGLNISAPPNSNIAPPGYYMLFLIDSNGVPSVAEMIRVEQGPDIGAPLIARATGQNNTATIQWIPVLGATSYTVKYGTESGNYTTTITVGDVRTLNIGSLTAWPYYFAVSASNASATGGDSAEVQVFSPTAAAVSISGQVTSPDGRGLSNVRVTLEGDGTNPGRTATTSSFGYYTFDNVAAGQTFVVSVSAKRYSFPNPTLLVQTEDNVSDANFVSDPLE